MQLAHLFGRIDTVVRELKVVPIIYDDAVGLRATFFVTTDRLDGDYEFWWDVLEGVLLAPARALPPVLELDSPDGPRAFATATHDDRATARWSMSCPVDAPSGAIHDTTAALIRCDSTRSIVRESFDLAVTCEESTVTAPDGPVNHAAPRHAAGPNDCI